MTGFNKRVYEMLVRVTVFASTYPQFFVSGMLASELMARIEAAARKLSANAASQLSGKGAARRSADGRAQARQALRDQLEAISRIARAIQLTQFWLPRGRGDVAAVEAGKAFAIHAEPLKQLFIDNHLPPDFIDRLNIAVLNVERAINDQTFSKGNRLAATAAIEQSRDDALAALQRLDPIMENTLHDDSPVLAVWRSARRVERSGSSKAAGEEGKPVTPPSTPPETPSSATPAPG